MALVDWPHVSVCEQAGQTALDQARDHNNPDIALLLTKAPQVSTGLPSLSSRGTQAVLLFYFYTSHTNLIYI